jgi:signal transduction histidine kinase
VGYHPSFRARVLLVVLVVAVIPLGLVGVWLTRSAARSGEQILRSRLNEALEETRSQILRRWVEQRSALLFLAEERETQAALYQPSAEAAPPAPLIGLFEALGPAVPRIVVRDSTGADRWTIERETDGGGTDLSGAVPALLSVPLDIRDHISGQLIGRLVADVRVEVLLPAGAVSRPPGIVVSLFDLDGVALTPTPVDPALLDSDREAVLNASADPDRVAGGGFLWTGDVWLMESQALEDPPARIVVAAPLAPFTEPVARASKQGLWVLLLVSFGAVGGAVWITGHLTRSLRDLSDAADAVSRGDLSHHVPVGGKDEVGRVAEAFNTMTQSLVGTLERLSTRESLAAVGQFAASLAHEVRNPLTAIRLDLQRVQEALPADFDLYEDHARALDEIQRLNDTVESALASARTGASQEVRVDLKGPIHAAAQASAPAFTRNGAELTLDLAPPPSIVLGDEGALEQLFLNLLQNAAEALTVGGDVVVTSNTEDGDAVVVVSDSGPGLPPELLEKVFEPLFTTRPEGTGLGLTVARRIAMAHGGTLELESAPAGGLRAVVRLPIINEVTAGGS